MSMSCFGVAAPRRRPAPPAAMIAVTCMGATDDYRLASMFATAPLLFLLAQSVVRYEPKESDLKYVFGVAEPVARVKPGDVIDTKTFDCFVNKIQKPGDTLAKVPGDN